MPSVGIALVSAEFMGAYLRGKRHEEPLGVESGGSPRRLRMRALQFWFLSLLGVSACGAPPQPRPALPATLIPQETKPPTNIGILISAPAPARDLARLAALVPTQGPDSATLDKLRQVLRVGPSLVRSKLGEGLSDAVSESSPAFLAFGSDPEKQIALAVPLARELAPVLPAWLELGPAGSGVQSLRARDSSPHEWLGDDGACQVVRPEESPHGVLVCASAAELLTQWGQFLGSLPGRTEPLPAIEVRVFPSILQTPIRELDPRDATESLIRDLLFDFARNVDEFRLSGVIAAEGVRFEAELRCRATTDLISLMIAGARSVDQPLPPEFKEVPANPLLAFSFSGLDRTSAEPVVRAFLHSVAGASKSNSPETAMIQALMPSGNSLFSFAMGMDFKPVERWRYEPPPAPPEPAESEEKSSLRYESGFLADAPAVAPAAPTAQAPERWQGSPWFLLRVSGVGEVWQKTLVSSFGSESAGQSSSAGLRVATASERTGLPAGAIYLVPRDASSLHLVIIPRGKAALIAIAEGADVAKRLASESVRAQNAFASYFRPENTNSAAGLGFVSASLAGAMATTEYLGVTRATLDRIRAASGGAPPASFRYEIERAIDGSARARMSLNLPAPTVAAWFAELAIGLE